MTGKFQLEVLYCGVATLGTYTLTATIVKMYFTPVFPATRPGAGCMVKVTPLAPEGFLRITAKTGRSRPTTAVCLTVSYRGS